jgi:hypothetical protein
MRVAILPTGRAEMLGLPEALGGLFPGHDFYALSRVAGSNEPFDSFTSAPLSASGPVGAASNVGKIVQQMAAELVPGRRGKPADLLVVVDDLELVNRDQPQFVVDTFCRAIDAHLQGLQRDRPAMIEKVREALRQKASLHLAAPMLEAWFFADPAGLTNAGVPAERLPANWERHLDPEDFLTQERSYFDDDAGCCDAWRALPESRRREHRPAWLCDSRERHPKGFLAWLCRNPGDKKCSSYRETHEGARALRSLDWRAALSNAEHCTYLRALVEDLADGLGVAAPAPAGGNVAACTSHRARRSPQVLRNL